MAITFNQMPVSNRVPGPYVEVDGSRALGVQAADPHRVLILGLRLSSGTALQGEIKQIVGQLDGDTFFGANSQLAAMTRAYKRVNSQAKVYAMAMDEASGGTAAAGSFAFSGTSTATFPLAVRVGDVRVTVQIPNNTAAAAAVTSLVAGFSLSARNPMTASAATATCNLVNRHKGTHGNEVTIAVESLPPGLTVTVTQPAGGATDPDLSVAVAALDEDRYDTIVSGFNGAANMLILENEMARRWGPLVKQPGMIHAAKGGSHGTLTTYGNNRNSQFSSVMGSGLSPTPSWIWAAQAAARDGQRSDSDPNRPRKGLTLPDCEAPPKSGVFDAEQRNLLLYDGISTFNVDQSGRCSIERLITTYQVNSSNQSDATYLAIETQRNLAGIYLELLTLGSKYADYKLMPDGTPVDPGGAVVSPSLYRGEIIAHYASLVRRARCYDPAGFAAELLVEIDPTDKERLNVEAPHRLVGGLVTLAQKISFVL